MAIATIETPEVEEPAPELAETPRVSLQFIDVSVAGGGGRALLNISAFDFARGEIREDWPGGPRHRYTKARIVGVGGLPGQPTPLVALEHSIEEVTAALITAGANILRFGAGDEVTIVNLANLARVEGNRALFKSGLTTELPGGQLTEAIRERGTVVRAQAVREELPAKEKAVGVIPHNPHLIRA